MSWKTVKKYDEYLDKLSELILDSNYTTKDELQNLLSAHFGIMIMENEKPVNNDLKIQYDKKLEYLRQLQRIGSPKINIVANELSKLKNQLKESNIIIFNGDQLNAYGEFKEFIRARFGTALLSEFYELSNQRNKTKNQ